MVVNVAHRGASGTYPENTLRAFQQAVEIGVDEVELDLQFTRDHQLIAMHDATVDRTTDGSGKVGDLDFDQIKALDAGSWFDPQFAGESVPTWREILACLQGKVRLNVHLKMSSDPSGRYEHSVVRELRDFGMLDLAVILCDEKSVARFAAIDPTIQCRIGRGQRSPVAYIRRALEMGLQSIQPGRDITTPEFVRQAHQAGLAVHVFYADTPEDMRAYIEMGVDGILTNFPARLQAMLT